MSDQWERYRFAPPSNGRALVPMVYLKVFVGRDEAGRDPRKFFGNMVVAGGLEPPTLGL
jgi:hypothetical protein